ncbi:hypothetical protein BH10PSE3_BH10PSE3_08530 [soil metagenome]
MRLFVPRSRALLSVLVLIGLGACSRTYDQTSSTGATAAPTATAPVAGGPTTLKPGQWKTVTKSPMGPEESVQCVGEGYDPGAEAAQKASPCGKPTLTRTADGFQIDQACEKDHIKYALAGTVRGDFVTTATTELELVLSAYGRKQTLHLQAVSTYQGACPTSGNPDGQTPGK